MSLSVSERKKISEAWADSVKEKNQHLMIQIGGAPLPDVLQLVCSIYMILKKYPFFKKKQGFPKFQFFFKRIR